MNRPNLPKKLDKSTFDAYYEAYADSALRTAAAILRDDAAAADVVQETFLRVYLNMHKFDDEKKFAPWFYKILVNESKRTFAKRDDVLNIDECREPASYDAAADEYTELYEAMAKLDDKYRLVLILKYLNGCSDKQTAKILNLNLTTAKARIKRGKEKLRSMIAEGEQ